MPLIYFLRHIKTEANGKNIFCGRSESEPVPEDLESLCSIMAPKVDEVFCSPMKRCVKTAEAAGYRDLKLRDDLKEIDFGDWEEKSFQNVSDEDPEMAKDYLSKPLLFKFPNGESLGDVRKRSGDFLNNDLMPLVKLDKDIMIVGHSGSLRLLIMEIMGLDDNFFWKFSLDPAKLTTLQYDNHSGGTSFFIKGMNTT